MSERILNGDFSEGILYWDNGVGGGRAYFIGLEKAFGTSDPDSVDVWTYKMCQQFSSNDEILTATITVWAAWEAYPDDRDGWNQFIVELEKPDSSKATLVDTIKTAVIGSGNILDGTNIKSSMTQYGNYKLWLTLVTKSARSRLGDPPIIITQSQGWYDNISIDMTVKKYKAVLEAIGGAEAYDKTWTPHIEYFYKAVLEAIRLVESYETKLGKTKVVQELIQLLESYSTKVKFIRGGAESIALAEIYDILAGFKREFKETVGVSEAYSKKTSIHKSDIVQLTELYQIIRRKFKSILEKIALYEIFQAKRIHGNLETTYYPGLPTEWDGITPATTKWIKSKVEIS